MSTRKKPKKLVAKRPFDYQKMFLDMIARNASTTEKLSIAMDALWFVLEWYDRKMKKPNEKQSKHPVAMKVHRALRKINR